MLAKLQPYLTPRILTALSKIITPYDISSINRLAAFLATVDHESAKFTKVIENLRYTSPARLSQVWPSRFKDTTNVTACVNNPVALANYVYGNRMGNCDPDDGWKYRGRGYIMLTGRGNYTRMAKKLQLTPDALIEYITTPDGAMHVAGQWWLDNGLNILADRADITGITKIVNGGTTGLSERIALYKQYAQYLTT